ncbi:C3 And Pzp-Like Alpha-2-Macroglobulin Domain-Containing Protein 8 [Manis pentadactyla]|nr:C3 And Pzp-Like Alpha-2-Macroglobulin Domain-Containing Protein 8 [Manis pentadactyla]
MPNVTLLNGARKQTRLCTHFDKAVDAEMQLLDKKSVQLKHPFGTTNIPTQIQARLMYNDPNSHCDIQCKLLKVGLVD